MDRGFRIQALREGQLPVAAVPSRHVWELVEYLAYRRTQVQYSYGSTHFYVTFLHIDGPSAQRILEEWAESGAASAWRDDMPARTESYVPMS